MLQPGATVGPYRILEPLGEGGMGQVWLATDTRLERRVAIKSIPAEWAADPERIRRFQREAKTLASLNHPSIATAYGLEEADAHQFLVMEHVEGQGLDELLQRGPVPLPKLRQIAIEIAEALAVAHENGIVHRDLKPANIKLAADGRAKILDFGIAKVLNHADGADDQAPTQSLATGVGAILGTAGYLSPEQLQGQPVDSRSDIWAFGCVLYEMLTGRRMFRGASQPELIAAVLHGELDETSLPPDTPAEIRWLLRRCLMRDPRERLQHMGEARLALAQPDLLAMGQGGGENADVGNDEGGQAGQESKGAKWGLPIGLLLGAAVVGALWFANRSPSAVSQPTRKLEIGLEHLQLGMFKKPTLSPDGHQLVYVAEERLWVRELSRLQSRELPGTEGALVPFWSPDSAWIGFFAQAKLWKIAATGGDKIRICSVPDSIAGGAGATWGRDGRIVFSTGSTVGLRQVSSAGGEVTDFLPGDVADGRQDYHDPVWLDDNQHVLFSVHRGTGIDKLAVSAGEALVPVFIMDGQFLERPVYSPTGHLLFERQGESSGIWAVPYSISNHESTGDPFVVVPDGRYFTLADDGTLSFIRQRYAGRRRLIWVDRQGTQLGQLPPQWNLGRPSLSRDGQRVAAVVRDQRQPDLSIFDTSSGIRTRLTSDRESQTSAAWSPDDAWLIFREGDGDGLLRRKNADGTGGVSDIGVGYDPQISPDGIHVVFARFDRSEGESGDLWYQRVDGSQPAQRLVQAPGRQYQPQFSGDGRWVAYVSSESGSDEIYVTSFPDGDSRWQVSSGGGSFPRWAVGANQILYDRNNTMVAVAVRGEDALSFGPPKSLFSADDLDADLALGYDATADAQRFIIVQAAAEDVGTRGVTLIQNWYGEFGN